MGGCVAEGTLIWYAGAMLLNSGAATEALPFVEAVPPARPTDAVPIHGNLMVLPHTLRAEVYVRPRRWPWRVRLWLCLLLPAHRRGTA